MGRAANTTWNPSDKSANISLSAGDLTASATSVTDGAVRSTTSKTGGKIYFEVDAASTGFGGNTGIGLALGSTGLSSIGSSGVGVIVYGGGLIYVNGGFALSLGLPLTGIVSLAVDLVNSRFWVRLNALPPPNNTWNNTGADPAANTGGVNIASMFPTNPAFAVSTFNETLTSFNARFGGEGFSYAVPAGFSGWDALSVPVVGAGALSLGIN